MTEIFSDAIEAINAQFSDDLWLDFEVVSFLNGTLKIKASGDFCYYHECEIELAGVQYFSGSMV